MGDILTFSIFLTIWLSLIQFGEWLKAYRKEQRMRKSAKVVRYRYDVVFNWLCEQLAKEYGNEIPDFMNRQIIVEAHARAVEIAQSGRLHKVYRLISGF